MPSESLVISFRSDGSGQRNELNEVKLRKFERLARHMCDEMLPSTGSIKMGENGGVFLFICFKDEEGKVAGLIHGKTTYDDAYHSANLTIGDMIREARDRKEHEWNKRFEHS